MRTKPNYLSMINDYRIKFSSYKNIIGLGDNNFIKSNSFVNNKLINLNVFELKIGNRKKIRCSFIYTNPFIVNKTIVSKIKFSKTLNESVRCLCKKIFCSNEDKITLGYLDIRTLEDLVKKKNKYNKHVEFEHSLLIYWYIIYNNNFINNKQIYFDLLKYYYLKFLIGEFDFNQIIVNIISNQLDSSTQPIEYLKFHQCFYLFVEEFHHKYIDMWFRSNGFNCKNKIFNSNYIKLNPQEILSNCNNQYDYSPTDLTEQFEIPSGHNILFFIGPTNKVFLYDPDISNTTDFLRLKILFSSCGFILSNVSNRKPIQVITDDTNCVFYCLRLIEFVSAKKIKNICFGELKKLVFEYEFTVIQKNDMFNWIINLIKKIME